MLTMLIACRTLEIESAFFFFISGGGGFFLATCNQQCQQCWRHQQCQQCWYKTRRQRSFFAGSSGFTDFTDFTLERKAHAMTPDEIRRLIAARAPELSEADLASLSAQTGEEMVPVSVFAEVLAVAEMLEARMVALEGGAQSGELEAVA